MLTTAFNTVQPQKWGLRSLLHYHQKSRHTVVLLILQGSSGQELVPGGGVGTTPDPKYVMIKLSAHLVPHQSPRWVVIIFKNKTVSILS